MLSFVGWAPTVTGRLSFSQIGSAQSDAKGICNRTATPDSFLFGAKRRLSRDGPFPSIIMRLFRVPTTEFLLFLRVEPGDLPVARDACSDAASDEHDPVLRPDQRGRLSGEVFFLSKGKEAREKTIKATLKSVRRLATQARAPRASQEERETCFAQARDEVEALWNELTRRARSRTKTPAFGRARVTLHRTGQCRIDIEPAVQFTTLKVKHAQAAGAANSSQPDIIEAFARSAEWSARQVFFLIRDLAHQHYHHEAHSDLLTTTYAWTPQTDELWRRETRYGLARMAIAVRRRDIAESYKQALGIIAYAEAFQRHLCGWRVDETGVARLSDLRFEYDFGSLRNSIDASLKVRELKDAQRRQTLLFCFGLVVTALGIVVSGLRGGIMTIPRSALLFHGWIDTATAYPLLTLLGAWLVAWFVDLAFLRLSLRPPFLKDWMAGLSRFAGGVMGALRTRAPRWIAYIVGVLVVGAVTLGAGLIFFFTYYLAFQRIAGGP